MRCIRPSLDGLHFDVVVIGGGISGVAIARECALGGRRTLLLEQHDFGSGTTSRSTRIIHGGLRYLEHGELGLVRQSLRERQRLLCERRHLVRPMRFLLAIPEGGDAGRSALEIRLALWMYRRLSCAHSLTSDADAERDRLSRLLDQQRHWMLFDYEDAQCEYPERLVAEWLVEAVAASAVPRNYTEVLEIDVRDRRVAGVLVRDSLTTAEAQVSATWVINAAGPWVDRVCARSGVQTLVPLVGGVRGSHLVLSNVRNMPRSALYAEAVDNRPIFVVPWSGQLLVGTTEVRDQGDPARTEPSNEEVEYLLTSVQRLLPYSGIAWEHVRSAFAGVRALPFSDQRPSAISRKYILHDHADDGATGMISVIGGKLTTASALGRECARKIGIHVPEPPAMVLASCECDGMESTLNEWATAVAARSGTSPQSARAIAEWHGRRALTIAAMAGARDSLRVPICDHTSHVTAEAVAAVQSEYAITLADVLLRRVPVALGSCWSRECGRLAATRIGRALNWDSHHTAEQLEMFEQERAAFLRKPELTRTEWQPRAA